MGEVANTRRILLILAEFPSLAVAGLAKAGPFGALNCTPSIRSRELVY